MECVGENKSCLYYHYDCVATETIINKLLYTANCGPLPSPTNGYVLPPYTSTLEGASVIFACQNGNQSEMMAVCTQAGKWEPNPTGVCVPGKLIS